MFGLTQYITSSNLDITGQLIRKLRKKKEKNRRLRLLSKNTFHLFFWGLSRVKRSFKRNTSFLLQSLTKAKKSTTNKVSFCGLVSFIRYVKISCPRKNRMLLRTSNFCVPREGCFFVALKKRLCSYEVHNSRKLILGTLVVSTTSISSN